MDITVIMLGEISQTDKYHISSLICGILKKKKKGSQIQRTRVVAARGDKGEVWRELGEGGQKSKSKIN